MSPVILGAPVLCSLVVRRGNELPGWLRLAYAMGVFIAWVAISVIVARALGLIPR